MKTLISSVLILFASLFLSTGNLRACDVVVGGPVGVVPASFGVQQSFNSFGAVGIQSGCGASLGIQQFAVPSASFVSLQANPFFVSNNFASFSSFNSFNSFGAVAVAQPVVVVRQRGLVGRVLGNVFAPRVRVRVRGW